MKFHPDANNHAVKVIEEEGCEAELPTLIQFFHYSLASGNFERNEMGNSRKTKLAMDAGLWVLERYEDAIRRAFEKTNGKFEMHRRIKDMAARSVDIAGMGNQAGEGWYLTAEMVDMIEHGCPNIICAQPFGCQPNHVIGKGMFRALRNRYPQANVVAVDYDPGASEVNQLNRIKLMIATALRGEEVADDFDGLPEGGSGAGCGCASSCGSGVQWNSDGQVSPAGRRSLPITPVSAAR